MDGNLKGLIYIPPFSIYHKMKLISKILKDKKNIVITFTDEEQLILRYEVFIKNGLRKSDDISEEKYKELIKQNQVFIAKEHAFRFLGVRLHSIKELERKLSQKKINNEVISIVIHDLIYSGYLDDEKFAREYSAERIKNRKLGTKKIRQELFSRGISSEIVDSLHSGKEKELNEENAVLSMQKKLNSAGYKNLSGIKLRQKLFNYLYSKGFDYDSINNALNELPVNPED
jgi:regulatory protein